MSTSAVTAVASMSHTPSVRLTRRKVASRRTMEILSCSSCHGVGRRVTAAVLKGTTLCERGLRRRLTHMTSLPS